LALVAAAIASVMGFHLALFLFLASIQVTLSQDIEHGSLLVNGAQPKAETGDNFICATIDWWPHDKCDYDHCSWGYSSVVNLVSIVGFSSVLKTKSSLENLYFLRKQAAKQF
jgi:hypothetical protein